MKRIGYSCLATLALAVGLLASSVATAGDGRTCPGDTPNPVTAVVETRIWNDCPTSTLSVTNAYPFEVSIHDQNLDCFGYANLHTWSYSTDGATKAAFENCSHYAFYAQVVLSGSGNGEGGLRLSPWWAPDTDGKFNLRTTDGEIACFGGRLPFYSFTAAHGLHYVKDTPATLYIVYNPRTLDVTFPATIEYKIYYGGTLYTSGPLNFDQGTASEDPPHGLWGALYPHYIGGYVQPFLGQGVAVDFKGSFTNICFEGPVATPAETATWGRLKGLYR
jgi:hypothetical protein